MGKRINGKRCDTCNAVIKYKDQLCESCLNLYQMLNKKWSKENEQRPSTNRP